MSWKKYFSVEVVVLFGGFVSVIQGAIFTNLVLFRSCYVLLDYDEDLCRQLGKENNNITDWLEPKVQPTANYIIMVRGMISHFIPLLFTIFVGSWSDKFGRKPFMLVSMGGLIVTYALDYTLMYIKYASPWWLIVSTVPTFITGSYKARLVLISAYLTDVTTEKDRVLRLGIYEVLLALASVVGNLSTSYLFYATSYKAVYLICFVLTVFCFVYTLLFIPESLRGEKKPFSFDNIMISINLKTIVKEVIKKRKNNARPYLFALLGMYTIYSLDSGEVPVGNLFLRAKLHWTLKQITILDGITSIGNILGTLIGSYFLYKKLKIGALRLCVFGIALVAIADILRAVATNNSYIYIARVAHCFYLIPNLMFRTIFSFILAPEEMGTIFALLSIIIDLDGMLSKLIYPLVYNATLDINSGLYNYMSLGIHVSTIIIILLLMRVKIPYYECGQGQELTEKSRQSKSIEKLEVLDNNEKRFSLFAEDVRRLSQTI